MPNAVTFANAVAIGNLIYLVGGATINGSSNIVQVFNTTNNTWSTVSSMNISRSEAGTAVVNGIIYVIGGYIGTTQTPTNVVEAYNPSTNTWVTKAPMPTSRSQLSVAVINNYIYAMGGWPNALSTVEKYDPSKNIWITVASLPFGHEQPNSAVGYSNNCLYFIGGKNVLTTSYYNNNECYNASTNTWSEKTAYPLSIFGGAIAIDSINGIIHYTGGSTIPSYYNTYSVGQNNSHYIYYITTDQWGPSVSLPISLAGHASVFVNGKLYILGGVNSNGVILNTVYSLY